DGGALHGHHVAGRPALHERPGGGLEQPREGARGAHLRVAARQVGGGAALEVGEGGVGAGVEQVDDMGGRAAAGGEHQRRRAAGRLLVDRGARGEERLQQRRLGAGADRGPQRREAGGVAHVQLGAALEGGGHRHRVAAFERHEQVGAGRLLRSRVEREVREHARSGQEQDHHQSDQRAHAGTIPTGGSCMLSAVPGLGVDVRKLVTLALPLAVAQLAQNAMGFVDTLMVGRLGPTALAGLALGATTFSTLYVILMAVLLSVSPLVAQAVGARRAGEPARVARQGLLLALALAVPGMAVMFLVEPLLRAAGLPAGAVELAGGYLRAVALGMPFALGFMALRGYFEGQGDARPILYLALAGVGLNVFLNDALIFGRYGLPALGVVGTRYATASVYLALFAGAALLARARYRGQAPFRGFGRPDPTVLREIVRVGWPISATLGLEVGLFSTISFLMGGFGDAVLAGHQIAMQSASMTFMIPLGIATATGVLVGQAAGRGDPAGVRRAGTLGIGLATGFMSLTALLF